MEIMKHWKDTWHKDWFDEFLIHTNPPVNNVCLNLALGKYAYMLLFFFYFFQFFFFVYVNVMLPHTVKRSSNTVRNIDIHKIENSTTWQIAFQTLSNQFSTMWKKIRIFWFGKFSFRISSLFHSIFQSPKIHQFRDFNQSTAHRICLMARCSMLYYAKQWTLNIEWWK